VAASVPEMSVIVVSGHMVDTPDRSRPRFPAGQVPRVAAEIREALARLEFGPEGTLVTGGARGADIIAGEEALERGAAVRLVLAFEPDEFRKGSVTLPDSDWDQRFDALLARASFEVVDGPQDGVYARTNARIIDVARALEARPHAVVVWNGEEGDGPGGTSDFVAQLRRVSGDERLTVIDPTPA
jgi:hypothetical protein